jgi:hypothetical protein
MRYAALKKRAKGLHPRNIDPAKLAQRLLMLVNHIAMAESLRMPVPMMNIINGGAHADK